jgi:hypothetical protein
MNFLFISLFLLGSEVLDHEMGGIDRKKTGVYKLSDKEKALLQNWISTYYQKRKEPILQEAKDKHAILQENLQSSQFIRLSDETLWKVCPENISIAQGWITPVEIIVSQENEEEYPFRLTNSLTGSSIQAKKVDKLTP